MNCKYCDLDIRAIHKDRFHDTGNSHEVCELAVRKREREIAEQLRSIRVKPALLGEHDYISVDVDSIICDLDPPKKQTAEEIVRDYVIDTGTSIHGSYSDNSGRWTQGLCERLRSAGLLREGAI